MACGWRHDFTGAGATSEEIPLRKWRDGHFKDALPELAGEHQAARFEDMGLVESASLLSERRIACLTPYGIHLLQQRFIWYLTRFSVPTHRLAEATEAVFEEAELEEEWVSRAAERALRAMHLSRHSISGFGLLTNLEVHDRNGSTIHSTVREYVVPCGSISRTVS